MRINSTSTPGGIPRPIAAPSKSNLQQLAIGSSTDEQINHFEHVDQVALGSLAGRSVPPAIGRIARTLNAVVLQHPDRIWPNYSWKPFQALLVDRKALRAWLWNDHTAPQEPGALHEVPFSTVTSDQLAADFAYSKRDGVDTFALNVDGASSDVTGEMGDPGYGINKTALALHEGFHYFGQQHGAFAPAPSSGQALGDYPELERPRYLRTQLRDALHRALLTGDARELSAAAYWQSQLRAEFPDEVKKAATGDVLEGTARYAEVVGVTLARLGAEVSDQQLLDAIKASLDPNKVVASPGTVNRDSESYDIGLLSCLLLRQSQPRDDWQRRVQNLETPLDVLLENVKPVPQPDDPEVVREVHSQIADFNKQIAPTVSTLLANVKDPGRVRIAIPFKWIQGAWNVGFRVNLTAFPGKAVGATAFSGEASQPNGAGHLSLAPPPDSAHPGNDVIAAPLSSFGVPSQSEQQSLIVTVPASALTRSPDGTFQVSVPGKLKGDKLPLNEMKDAAGRTWLVAE